MPLVTSNEIITQVNSLLNDVGFVRWPKTELLGFLNAAQKAIVLRRPDAYTVNEDDFSCVVGTKQTLPEDALRLIDITNNGSGMSIRGPYQKDILDNNYPNWYGGKTATEAELYLYDERNPKAFHLYPGVIANSVISIVYSKVPPVITEQQNTDGEIIALDDIYENAISEWIMYRCYSKDAEYAANPNKAAMHLSAFKTQIGEKSQADNSMAKETVKDS